MKTFLNILKFALELSIPLLLSIALNDIDNANHSNVDLFVHYISILLFVILFLEWIRRYIKKKETSVYLKEETSEFIKYLWIAVLIILFVISVQVIFKSDENNLNYMQYLYQLSK